MIKSIQRATAAILLVANDIILLYKTWLGRTYKWDPLSKLWESWYIHLNSRGIWDYSPTLNLLMLSPMLFLLCGLFPKFFEKKSFLKAAVIAFLTSACIEGIQFITCLGTVQISDLVYNTLSGILGVFAYRVLQSAYYAVEKASQYNAKKMPI